jgi:hypothetical protein
MNKNKTFLVDYTYDITEVIADSMEEAKQDIFERFSDLNESDIVKIEELAPILAYDAVNYSGYVILEINDDFAVVAYHAGQGYQLKRKCKLHYNTKGCYFVRYGKRFYLHDFMRV